MGIPILDQCQIDFNILPITLIRTEQSLRNQEYLFNNAIDLLTWARDILKHFIDRQSLWNTLFTGEVTLEALIVMLRFVTKDLVKGFQCVDWRLCPSGRCRVHHSAEAIFQNSKNP